MEQRKILIVGGGISGMALSLRMRDMGWAVDLVELDPQWRVYGAGISVTAPTMRAFRRLGIVDEVCRQGYGSTGGVRLCAPDGALIVESPGYVIEPGLPTHGGIMRPMLHQILSNRTRESATNIRLGVTVTQIEPREHGVTATTSDGLRRDYDLVVGADGVLSEVRALLFPGTPAPKYTGQYCWRLTAERPAEVTQCSFYLAGAVTAGVMPVSDAQMYMFLLQTLPQKIRIDESTQWQLLSQLMAPFGGLLGRVRDGLSAQSNIISRPLEAILLPRPWHRGHVVLIGDAVHATTPHLASGAGLAVEDALVLGEEIARDASIPAALARFEERRFERCRMVVENSVRIGELEQHHGDPARLNQLMTESTAALLQDI